MNEGEIKSQVASPEARKACALELRSEHKLHATKHGIKLGEKIYFKKIYLRNYFLNYNI